MAILLYKLIVHQIRFKLFYCLFFLMVLPKSLLSTAFTISLPPWGQLLSSWILTRSASLVGMYRRMYTGFAFISTLIRLYLRQYAFSTIVDDLFLTVTASIHSDLFFAYAICHSLYFSCSSRRIDIWVTSVYSKDCNEHKAIYRTANNVYIY